MNIYYGSGLCQVSYIFSIFIFIKVHIVFHIMSVKNFIFIKSKRFLNLKFLQRAIQITKHIYQREKIKIVRCLYF